MPTSANQFKSILAFIVIILNLNANSQKTRYVKEGGTGNGISWVNASGDLQLMVNESSSDDADSVFVAAGTYYPIRRADYLQAITLGDKRNSFVLKKNVTILGGFPRGGSGVQDWKTNVAILSGDLGVVGNPDDNACHVVIAAGDVGTAVLDGFTITAGRWQLDFNLTVNGQPVYNNGGGGIHCSYSSPLFRNLSVKENYSQKGGGIANYSSSPVFVGISLDNNSSDYGGGVYNEVSTSHISESTFLQNVANYAGGAIYNLNSTAIINSSVINRNSSANIGGAVFSYKSIHNFTNVIISGNKASRGGGIYIDECTASNLFTGILISGNEAKYGAGIYNDESSPVFTNLSISGNKADYGGGMFNDRSSPLLRNLIIFGNSSGIYNDDASVASIIYSLVQEMAADLDNRNIDGSVNPGFVNMPSFSSAPFIVGDYKINATSPVVNKGNIQVYGAGQQPDLTAVVADLAGNKRFSGSTIDVGAYEYITSGEGPCTALNSKIYVDSSRVMSGDGKSWVTAFKTLAEALSLAATCGNIDSILLAKGTYYPDRLANAQNEVRPDNRSNSFVLVPNVTVSGGYPPGGGAKDVVANPVILSGDVGKKGIDKDNAYHVVISVGNIGNAGITNVAIENGVADGSDTVVRGNVFLPNNMGAGMFLYGSSPRLISISVSDNMADKDGGGLCISNDSKPVLVNVVITGNKAKAKGAAVYNTSASSPILTNVTIAANFSGDSGVIYNKDANMQMRNTVVYGNSSGLKNDNATTLSAFSLVQEMVADTARKNLGAATDPRFTAAVNYTDAPTIFGNYSLLNSSPLINMGNNAYYAEGQLPDILQTTSDINGNKRTAGSSIDIGAYENIVANSECSQMPPKIFVDNAVIKSGNGRSWESAFKTLGEALWAAKECGYVDSILVAKGTYYPDRRADAQNILSPGDKNNAFVLLPNVKILGGYSNGGDDRDWNIYATVLNGNNGTQGVFTDDVNHVVVSAGDVGSALLDGFTLAYAYANTGISILVDGESIPANDGGGITVVNSSPRLQNLTVAYNYVMGSGAGISIRYGSPEISNSIIMQNRSYFYGGGIITIDGSPQFKNVTVCGNDAGYGAGISNHRSSPVFTNTLIFGNNSSSSGGGMGNSDGATPTLTNVTISGNKSSNNGGGMTIEDASNATIRNTVIYGNTSGIYNYYSYPTIKNSLIQGLGADAANGNLSGDLDPEFMYAPSGFQAPFIDGYYALRRSSLLIDKGDSTYYSPENTPNLSLVSTGINSPIPRTLGHNTDIGAYEFDTRPCNDAPKTIYVDSSIAQSGNGKSWNTAYKTLGEAIALIENCGNTDSILIAKGTYYPDRSANVQGVVTPNKRTNSFVMQPAVKMLGGYPTGGGYRNISRNRTILSGNVGAKSTSEDNVYHVVIAVGDNINTASLEGVVVTEGRAVANGSNFMTINNMYGLSDNHGAGIFCGAGASPLLYNVCVRANEARDGGGGLYCIGHANPTIASSSITGNKAAKGGGLYNQSASPYCINLSMAGNNAAEGGAIFNSYSSSLTLRNSILYGNSSGIATVSGSDTMASNPTIEYSLVQGSPSSSVSHNLDGSINPLFEYLPLYTLAPTALGSFGLKHGSNAIDKGNQIYYSVGQSPDLSGFKTDVLGNKRIVGTNVDMGAHEGAPGGVREYFCPNTQLVLSDNFIPEGVNFQWQVDTGSGFANIVNLPGYTGVNTNTLQISASVAPTEGTLFRFYYAVHGEVFYSRVFNIKYANQWVGTESTAWENAANWSCGAVPDKTTFVVIDYGSVDINMNTAIKGIKLGPSVNVHLAAGVNLTVVE